MPETILDKIRKQNAIIKGMWSIPGYGSDREWDYEPVNYGRYYGEHFIPTTGFYGGKTIMFRDMEETNSNDPGMNYIYSSSKPQDRVIRISDDGKSYSREHLAPGPYREVTTKELLEREALAAKSKEESDLISRARLRMAADAKPLNPLGSTALKVGFYEGPLDWYKRKGFTDTSIKDLQTKLRSAGYEVGDIDGIIGTKTLNAIKLFQKDNNLTVDGLFGNNTKRILESKLAQIAPSLIEPEKQYLAPGGGRTGLRNRMSSVAGGYLPNGIEVRSHLVVSPSLDAVSGIQLLLYKIGGQLNYQKIFK